jgi:hypothetical protein
MAYTVFDHQEKQPPKTAPAETSPAQKSSLKTAY